MTWMILVLRALTVAGVIAASHTAGCEQKPASSSGARQAPKETKVAINGKTFTLETALTPTKQFQGLSGRTDIPADGGMVFVFPTAQERYFVMRDCPVPIDIVFLDSMMKVTAQHEMVPETPRSEAEKVNGINGTNEQYEARLARYHSKFPAQYVLEFKGGTLKQLNIKEGQKIELDPDLRKWSR
ncbi:MAG: DUF192 domain-containing protein [Tepidisphaera sp.]